MKIGIVDPTITDAQHLEKLRAWVIESRRARAAMPPEIREAIAAMCKALDTEDPIHEAVETIDWLLILISEKDAKIKSLTENVVHHD